MLYCVVSYEYENYDESEYAGECLEITVCTTKKQAEKLLKLKEKNNPDYVHEVIESNRYKEEMKILLEESNA